MDDNLVPNGCRGAASSSLHIEPSEINVHEAGEPRAVASPMRALTGSSVHAKAAAGGDDFVAIAEPIMLCAEPGVATQ
jgi:hypothetical protein